MNGIKFFHCLLKVSPPTGRGVSENRTNYDKELPSPLNSEKSWTYVISTLVLDQPRVTIAVVNQ